MRGKGPAKPRLATPISISSRREGHYGMVWLVCLAQVLKIKRREYDNFMADGIAGRPGEKVIRMQVQIKLSSNLAVPYSFMLIETIFGRETKHF